MIRRGRLSAKSNGTSTVLVPFDVALNRPRRITPDEKMFLARYEDGPAPE